jgi:hypothetical protein
MIATAVVALVLAAGIALRPAWPIIWDITCAAMVLGVWLICSIGFLIGPFVLLVLLVLFLESGWAAKGSHDDEGLEFGSYAEPYSSTDEL